VHAMKFTSVCFLNYSNTFCLSDVDPIKLVRNMFCIHETSVL